MLKTASQLGALAVCDLLGVNTELSYTRASEEYGQFFRDMVRSGRLRPCRKGKGKNGTHWYSVRDIVLLKAEESEKAKLV